MTLSKKQCNNIKNWMYRNARPIDIARWKYHFENGSELDVLTALSAYQNDDGGFGYALEADSWNPNSSPIQTWVATEILYELGITNKNNPIVKGILSYLESGKDYRDGYWYAEVPSNNDYPHAPWWTHGDNVIEEWGYNPTACLIGFILLFAEKSSRLYKQAEVIAKKAVKELLSSDLIKDMHELLCFIRLYEYSEKSGNCNIFDMDILKAKLIEQVQGAITHDKEKWSTCYVCKPSQFFYSSSSIFYEANKAIADYEVEFIIESMAPDGYWDINWSWQSYPNEWAISKNWWKANKVISNLRYLKGFGCL
ncbi:hypothetical protein R9X47_20565 [Wukongibacter baidiensis]|uniref:hypothetical protein n=1 Tax=Wukongibacter baidiensis TaxID=1723361 RepID=UPI003D7FF898